MPSLTVPGCTAPLKPQEPVIEDLATLFPTPFILCTSTHSLDKFKGQWVLVSIF